LEIKKMAQTIAEYYAEQGMVRGKRHDLQLVLEHKFGTLPQALVTRINALTDLEVLDHLFRQSLELKKLHDLQFQSPDILLPATESTNHA
jgi:hypothetical protein